MRVTSSGRRFVQTGTTRTTAYAQHRLDVWRDAVEKLQAGKSDSIKNNDLGDNAKLQQVAFGSIVIKGMHGYLTPLNVLRAAKDASAADQKSKNNSTDLLSEKIDSSAALVALINTESSVKFGVGAQPWDLRRPLPPDTRSMRIASARALDASFSANNASVQAFEDRDAVLSTYWHSGAHLLGWAIEQHFGDDALLDDGPALPAHGRVGGGFYYDSLLVKNYSSIPSASLADRISALLTNSGIYHASNEDLETIAKLMNSLAASKTPFERLAVSRSTAQDLFSYSPLKLSLLSRIPETAEISLYKCGDFIDLCRGPHLPHTGFLAVSKLIKTASAALSPTLVSDQSANPISRIYGVSFPRQKMLMDWIVDQAEALQRDHKSIGKQQSLFSIHPMSPGAPFMLPHGTRIANRLIDFIRREYRRLGFNEIVTPLVFNKELWVTSGHWENYREDMFLVTSRTSASSRLSLESNNFESRHDKHHEALQENDSVHGLKPMNCPGHCLVFANKSYSYRELPVRFAEFSPLHRNEASGALTGLTRVRKFHQDDAHIFCSPDQIQSEISSTLALIARIYSALQFPDYTLALSTRPEAKSIGTTEQWTAAENALRNALNASGRQYTIKQGDGAFYGPKIDIMVRDVLGRQHQTATVQLDFQLPARFGLHYVAQDGTHHTPVMIHRAVLGSVERMMGILMEHYNGRWPFWLSPRQAVVIPAVPDTRVVEYANAVAKGLAGAGVGWNVETVREKIKAGVIGDAVFQIGGSTRNGGDDTFFHVDAKLHDADATLAKRVRDAWVARYNFVVVVGLRELESGTISLRMNSDATSIESAGGNSSSVKKSTDKDLGSMTVEEVIKIWNNLYPK
ncbi:54S ribosomal protein L39, mitochondrial [Physocladia obscura]|uniref:threonine--tRNA ligase n=1 Tax=Physocladia obscura TaxID=109957 RepID=A0AAD5XJE1_9FUNG|nr:54S ribosomal protein L39, mitochondrial [Physocladia obscura]